MNAVAPKAWWPLTRKMQGVVAGYLSTESAAVVGELSTGMPGWNLILAGAIPGGLGIVLGYYLRDASSPA